MTGFGLTLVSKPKIRGILPWLLSLTPKTLWITFGYSYFDPRLLVLDRLLWKISSCQSRMERKARVLRIVMIDSSGMAALLNVWLLVRHPRSEIEVRSPPSQPYGFDTRQLRFPDEIISDLERLSSANLALRPREI